MKVTSNGSRKVIKLTSLWYNKTHYKPLMWTKKSWGGRSSFGRVSIWTKKSLKIKLIIPRINYSLRTSNIFFIDTLKLVPGSNKLIALIFLSCGGVSYIPTTESHKVFSIMHPVWKSFSSLSTSILATNQPFLVMMININSFYIKKKKNVNYFYVVIFFKSFFFFQFIIYNLHNLFYLNLSTHSIFWITNLIQYKINDILLFSNILYTYFFINIILIALILLLTMIGSIALCLAKKINYD